MGLEAARALCPSLTAAPRDPDREQALLERLAAWAGFASPRVSLNPGTGLLLEVGGSAHLFGGPRGLLGRIGNDLSEIGYHARTALAPTPLAATWLARDGRHPITSPEQLRDRLGTLPITILDSLPNKTLDRLRKLGVTTLADCLALPRAGLARRLGKALPLILDQALGQTPDPRPSYQPPEQFQASLTLLDPLEHCSDLLLVIRRLVLELSGFLLARGNGVERVELQLTHPQPPATRLQVGLSSPSRDPERLLSLLRRRLERLELPQPVTEVGLLAPRSIPLSSRPRSLFDDGRDTDTTRQRLLDELRARLGRDAVSGICLRPDHRPERAWGRCEPGERVATHSLAKRPLWLLQPPRQLPNNDQAPIIGAPLSLEQGPERIETGWWDGHEVARDYYIARHPGGERYWVFRERQGQHGWFLHGLFA
jgi:protein ImuB